ncbi:hypothetical protein K503DRAFT_795908 [Rhizopogon vinicolor AM-OR11-026]|uniref:AB hydrolase-1 domain-containing protein n=1 Tax=Rhizopogon vinicolor AM-OR11-026 TaxID=1314800 RepID=A0A1B7NFZ9_9AGAM|nr:hypothetical protein K503DRAFT_795908 [Rhizopogon vinicolor AM-OR11-026]
MSTLPISKSALKQQFNRRIKNEAKAVMHQSPRFPLLRKIDQSAPSKHFTKLIEELPRRHSSSNYAQGMHHQTNTCVGSRKSPAPPARNATCAKNLSITSSLSALHTPDNAIPSFFTCTEPFTIGDASKPSPVLLSKDAHFISLTLPGWSNTSPPPPSTSYNACLTRSDMTALLTHHYSNSNIHDIKLYISGGSFGAAPAQILYGAPYDKFPFGRCILGVLLMGPISPFRYHKDFAKCMTWSNYFMTGPVAYCMPFNLMVRLMTFVLARRVATVEGAEAFLRETVFDKMDQAERETFARWREARGRALGETERIMAENIVKSVSKSWVDLMLIPHVLHSDWGFRPDELNILVRMSCSQRARMIWVGLMLMRLSV